MSEFESAIADWKQAAAVLAEAEVAYSVARGKALVSTGKNESVRQGEADEATKGERFVRDTARIEEQASRWRVLYHLALVGRERVAA